jgi:hypothetical protein
MFATQTRSRVTPPKLTSAKKEVEMAPTSFGELTDCTPLLDDAAALRRHMREEGYLLLRGLLDRDEVQAARTSMLERLAEQGHIDLTYPLDKAKAAPEARVAFKPDIAHQNPFVHKVVYDGPLMSFFHHFLGGPVRHYDYTWIRAVAPGLSTPPHMDVVYMGRGTSGWSTAMVPKMWTNSVKTGSAPAMSRWGAAATFPPAAGFRVTRSRCANGSAGAGSPPIIRWAMC